VTYSNGQIPSGSLVALSGGGALLPGAASAWEQLRSQVRARYGWTPSLTDALSAYRPYATQERIFRQRYTTTYLPGRPIKIWNGQRWYLIPGNVTSATPGTSNHGRGIAVDITGLGGFTGTKYKQLASVADGLGWSNVEGRSIGEAWHWVYTGPAETVSNPGANWGDVPASADLNAPEPIEEDDMPYTPEQLQEILAPVIKREALAAVVEYGRSAEFDQRVSTRTAERDSLHTALRASMLEQANKSRQAVYDLLAKVAKKIGA
jgi:hypothetical protein